MGPDGIPPKMLKLDADYLCKPVKYLINMSVEISTFPNELNAAEITPIFKMNDK